MHLLELPIARLRLTPIRLRVEAQHQRGGKRPGLRSDVRRVPREDARLLAHLTHHGLFRRLSRRDEAREDGAAPARPSRPATQQQPALVLDGHDHHRVGPREVMGVATGAATRVARLLDNRARAAVGAEPMPAVPVQERRQVRGQARLGVRQHGAGVAQGHDLAAVDGPVRALAGSASRSTANSAFPSSSPSRIGSGTGANSVRSNDGSLPSRTSTPSWPAATSARPDPQQLLDPRGILALGHRAVEGHSGERRCAGGGVGD